MPTPNSIQAEAHASAIKRTAMGKLLLWHSAIAIFAIAAIWLAPLFQPSLQTAPNNKPLAQIIWPSAVILLWWIAVAALLVFIHQRLRGKRRLPVAEPGQGNAPAMSGTRQSAALVDTTLQELELAREQAIQSSRIKSSLIARASHELLTPLNCISGFAGILQKENLSAPERQEYLQLITDNAQQLQTLVNDLISFADRHSAAVNIEYKPTRMHTLLSSVARSFSQTVQERGLGMDLAIEAVQRIEMDTDPVRLRQMLSNLVVNAIRNTKAGQITLTAQLNQTGQNTAKLDISVQDTGIGIAPQRLATLRAELASGSSAVRKRRRKYDSDDTENSLRIPGAETPGLGFGLGLPIVADLADRMGAALHIESEVDKGSRFTLSLPARNWRKIELGESNDKTQPRAHSRHKEDSEDKSHGAAPALVVDDNSSNRRLLQHLLTSAGHACDTVANGEDALALLRERRYAWLFIDITMFPMDGPTLLKQLRQLPGLAQVPCIACTALLQQEDTRRFRELGFDAILAKPIDVNNIATLAQRFDISPAEGAANAAMDSVFDIAGAISHASGNSQVACQITGLLHQELEQALQVQQRGLASNDDKLKHFHQLNGSASLGGTPKLKRMLVELESLLRGDEDVQPQELARLEAALAQHQRELINWLSEHDLETLFAAH
ncbi:MAG: response regulator [Gammaproteobacteria bacterium]|nr:response regulator [Gammaproteobacteria bacterium]NND37958.1 response regulator [Pseudomonadales bacterium]